MSVADVTWRPSASLEVLRQRASALAATRDFFRGRGVVETETPLIVGAPVSEAQLANVRCSLSLRPGATYYLHTSPEYHMKRLLAAGAPDLYQVCKVFRDGEMGPRHLPEFTMIEWYRRSVTLDAIIGETCELIAAVALCVGQRARPPTRIGYRELFMDCAGIDPLVAEPQAMLDRLAELRPGLVSTSLARGLVRQRDSCLDLVMVEIVEPALKTRGLVVVDRYPARQAALARLDPADPRFAERFEVYLHGIELANGYHELSDEAAQRQRFEADRARRRTLGLPDVAPDERLLAALAAGLPDCCGVALGFDRLLMACLGKTRIEDIVSFPVPED